MSVKRVSEKIGTGLKNFTAPTKIVGVTSFWSRPGDWLSLPSVLDTDQKVVGLHAVWPGDSNFIALKATTSGAQYLVDWGDGTTTLVNSGVNAEYKYDFTNPSLGAATSDGWKQAIVTITPVSGNLTGMYFHVKHSQAGLPSYASGFVDILVSGQYLTNLTVGVATAGSSTQNIFMSNLQQFNLISTNAITSVSCLFYTCTALQSIPFFKAPAATNWNSFFYGCVNLQYIPYTSSTTGLQTSAGTNFSNMFEGCIGLRYISAPAFDTGHGNNFSYMFKNCYNLQTIPSFDFNQGIGATFLQMFYFCRSLKELPPLNILYATSCDSMFYYCDSLKTISIQVGASCVSFSEMFYSCTSLTTVNVGGYLTGITNAYRMFYNCVSLIEAPLLQMTNVADTSQMFMNCYALKRFPDNFTLSKVATAANMFSSCYSLEYIGKLVFGTIYVNLTSMCSSCNSLITAPDIKFPTSNYATLDSMFSNCAALKNVPNYTWSPGQISFNNMFNYCSGIQSFPAFNFSNATSLNNTFNGCTSLISVPLFTMPTANCTANNMFYNCTSLKTVPALNCSKITVATSMFEGCSSLTDINITTFTNLTTIGYMFKNCKSLSKLPPITYSTVTSGSSSENHANNCYSLQSPPNLAGLKYGVDFSNCKLSTSALESIFDSTTVQTAFPTINITNNFGTTTPISQTCTLVIGNTTANCTNTAGILPGMQATGTGSPLTTTVSVSFSTGTNLVNKVGHALVNGDEVGFNTISTPIGTVVAGVIFYVVNAATDSFQVASTSGGTPLTFTSNATGNVVYRWTVVSVNPNVSIVFNKPALAGGNNSLSFRTLKTGTAIMKRWAVTG